MSSAKDEKLKKGSRGTPLGPHVGEDEISDLVGQLERYAENKTGKGKGTAGFGGTNNANKASAAGKKVRFFTHLSYLRALFHSFTRHTFHFSLPFLFLLLLFFSPGARGVHADKSGY